MATRAPFDLSGRTIFITGAAGGIGSATARLCVQQGARVILADVAGADAIRARFADAPPETQVHALDTTRRNDVEALIARIGTVDGLVDTAAVALYDDWTEEGWDDSLDRVLAVNIKGPINVTRALLPVMRAAGGGRMVLCGSIAGWMGGVRSGPHYAFSKGGMHAFIRWLSNQAVGAGILVNGIAPGPVLTGMTEGKGYDPSVYPMKRWGQPEEVAAAAVFLLGPGASYMSGAIIDVNGGLFFH
jgi:NAD(P)-dependent dehydrogenase (short-subunit alcohol dehydrogenase family)